jgi:hypothetical protein
VDFAEEFVLAKVENCFVTFFAPQCGQAGGCWFRPRINFSNVFPHFEHVYSKIGILVPDYSLALGSQVACLSFPAGAPVLGAQVNLESPGTRGAIRYQKIRKPAMRAKGR